MPEIIQYSNKLCYASEPLIPLRQFGADRLSPVIATRYVEDGYLKGNPAPQKPGKSRRPSYQNVNPPEAQALVDQIIECCKNPDYDGKSMGVITLVGRLQARYIEDLLLKELGPEEMVKRQIVCGDAYAFQGDERDVMFLSMVTAVSEKRSIGALSDESAKRRFNVAASRAKDQMWLFHSVMTTDLSTKCLRRDLLEYCLDPKIERSEVAGLDLSELRELARTADRDRIDQPSPFDSWFEIDVFLKITDRGYRAIPQFEINGRRIDFIVEGMKGRLAVECNGDKWHGPDQYEKDMARQRDLERAGLEFWTVRGTPFYLDPDEAMESLWKLLDRRAIYPDGAEPDEHPALAETENSEPDEESSSPSHAQDLNAIDASVGNIPAKRRRPMDISTPDATSDIQIAEYQEFEQSYLLDPRTLTTATVMRRLVEIVEAEGPIIARRAYTIYANSAGLHRVGGQLRAVFDKAVNQALSAGHLLAEDESGSGNQQDHVIRTTGAPGISVRMRGSRTLDQIPPREIAALMGLILAKSPVSEEPLYRKVLQVYAIGRLTAKAQDILTFARRICLEQAES
jgi:very-short-patch-repair endonuclease